MWAALCRHLVELGCIKPLCDLLTLMDSKIVQVALNGIENILRLGELEAKRGGGINPYCALIEEAYGGCPHTHFLLLPTQLTSVQGAAKRLKTVIN